MHDSRSTSTGVLSTAGAISGNEETGRTSADLFPTAAGLNINGESDAGLLPAGTGGVTPDNRGTGSGLLPTSAAVSVSGGAGMTSAGLLPGFTPEKGGTGPTNVGILPATTGATFSSQTRKRKSRTQPTVTSSSYL